MPIKNLNNEQVAGALELFLGIFPAMNTILTDHGRADFGEGFMQLLEEYNIKHTGEIPRRSQASGAVEMGNKLLQTQLARICASHLGKKFWHRSLPKTVQSINSYFPYKSKLSRVQLVLLYFVHKVGFSV